MSKHGVNNITKANYYYRLCRVREVCLAQTPETPAFCGISNIDNEPVKSPEKLPSMDGQPLLQIYNRAGISMDIFQNMPTEKLQSLGRGTNSC